MTSVRATPVKMEATASMLWPITNASVPVDFTVRGANLTLTNVPLSLASTGEPVKMDSTNTYANVKKVMMENGARMKLIFVSQILANTVGSATPSSIPTPANVNLVSKARIARLIRTIVFYSHAKMTEPVLITSMISCAFANLLLLARPARRRWTLASATIVPMEPPAHPTPTTKITRAPVLWDSLVGSAKKTLMSVR